MVLVIELGNSLLILSTLICSLMGVVDPLPNKDTIAVFNAIVNNYLLTYLGKLMHLHYNAVIWNLDIWRSDLSKDFYHMIIQRETFILLRNVSSGGMYEL